MPKKAFVTILPQNGFTLIELLVSIAIIAILAALTIASFTTLNKQVSIDSTTQNILSVLRRARSQTVASENQSSYGVHFETSKYVLFKGTDYVVGDSSNKEYNLSDSQITAITLAGNETDVVFDRIRGTTSQNGTIKLELNTDSNRTSTIVIDSSGQVSLNSSLTTTGTRIVDSRHLHFDLSNSGDCNSGSRTIQNSTTLTLVWTDSPNPSVTQNIPMAGFFNVGKTVFDWTGTVNVNGTDQTLRIHTHCLSASNTILSINRDLRYNNKALTVKIDNNVIVTYDAAGIATVGAWGGNMTVQ